jgi:hypothetical protein
MVSGCVPSASLADKVQTFLPIHAIVILIRLPLYLSLNLVQHMGVVPALSCAETAHRVHSSDPRIPPPHISSPPPPPPSTPRYSPGDAPQWRMGSEEDVYYVCPSRLPLPPSGDCWMLASDVGVEGANGGESLPLPTLAFVTADPDAVPEPEEGEGEEGDGEQLWTDEAGGGDCGEEVRE